MGCRDNGDPVVGFMQDHAVDRVELSLPGLLLDHAQRVGIAGLPALADSGRTEINVLGMILFGKARPAWRYFLAIAEDLNFTKAAERCNVSQPALPFCLLILQSIPGSWHCLLSNRSFGVR